MNTDEMLKYLGCAVLLVVLIYFVGVILKVNNDFIGSVLGGKFREGLSNKDTIKENIEAAIKQQGTLLTELNDKGGDFSENKDLITKLIANYQEIIVKQNIVSMTKGEDKWKLDNLSTNLTNKGTTGRNGLFNSIE